MDTPEAERIAPASVLGDIAFCSPESPARAPRALPAMGSPSSPLAKQGPASAHGSIRIALVTRLLPDSPVGKPPAKRLAALGPAAAALPHRDLKACAVSAAAARIPDYRAALKDATGKGEVLSTSSLNVARLEKEVDRLVLLLPDADVQRCLGMPDDVYDSLDGIKILAAMHTKARANNFKAHDFSRARNALCALQVFLKENNLEESVAQKGGVVPAYYISLYLAELRAKKLPGMRAKAEEKYKAQKALYAATPGTDALYDLPPRTGVKIQWGGSVGKYHLLGLKFLCNPPPKGLGVPWDMEKVDLERSALGPSSLPQSAEPVTMKMIVELEEFIANPNTSEYMRHIAAAYLFCCYCVMRVQQAQSCYILGVRSDEIIDGAVILDKNPKRAHQKSRPFWGPVYGITRSRLWYDSLRTSLLGVEEGCFIFRAFKSTDGSLANAYAWQNGPLVKGFGLVEAIQEMLMAACGFTIDQAQAYTLHSPKHFLTEVAAGRGEPATCRVEIGRWSNAVAQMESMRPALRMQYKHEVACASLPDLYAKHAVAERPITILQRQMKALRDFADSRQGLSANMPPYGGWGLLEKFKKTGGDFDE
jgi:hypothetical protein